MKAVFLGALLILLIAGIACGAGDVLEKIDINMDGRVDNQEFTNAVSKTFHSYDKDGDGSLDLRELRASKVADPDKLLNEIDTNKDGKIDYKEFLGAATKWFKVSDMNRDGFLDRSEFNALRGSSSMGLFLGIHF